MRAIWNQIKKYIRNIWNFWTGYTSITWYPVQKFQKQNLMIPRFLLRLFHVTIWICRWRRNMLVTSQYQSRLSSITKFFSRQISQSDCSIQIKLNYYLLTHTKSNTHANWSEILVLVNRMIWKATLIIISHFLDKLIVRIWSVHRIH